MSSTDASSAAAAPVNELVAVERALAESSVRHAALLGEVAPAIEYALLGGGKRLRARLMLAAYRATGGRGDASRLAAAIEIVHAYSLVHDDLPCMDDDDMRRGRPTVHRAFDVRTATVAGVAMVPLAAAVALEAARQLGLVDDVASSIMETLMRASGAAGMIGGQLLDLEAEGRELDLASLERVHRAKTGALIQASVVLGGLAAGATGEQSRALGAFGEAIGLAFQIADDVLDVTATTDRLGKTAGRDVDLGKSTYPRLLGVEGARGRAASLVADGCAALRGADLPVEELESLARFVVERES